MSEQSREWREGYAAGVDATGGGVEKLALQRASMKGYAEGVNAAKAANQQELEILRAELSDERRRFGKLFEALLAREAPELALRYAALERQYIALEADVWHRHHAGAEKTNSASRLYESQLDTAIDAIMKARPRIAAMSASAAARYVVNKLTDSYNSLPRKKGRLPTERKIADVIRAKK